MEFSIFRVRSLFWNSVTISTVEGIRLSETTQNLINYNEHHHESLDDLTGIQFTIKWRSKQDELCSHSMILYPRDTVHEIIQQWSEISTESSSDATWYSLPSWNRIVIPNISSRSFMFDVLIQQNSLKYTSESDSSIFIYAHFPRRTLPIELSSFSNEIINTEEKEKHFTCPTCLFVCPTYTEFIKHHRSEWHIHNQRVKTAGGIILSEKRFLNNDNDTLDLSDSGSDDDDKNDQIFDSNINITTSTPKVTFHSSWSKDDFFSFLIDNKTKNRHQYKKNNNMNNIDDSDKFKSIEAEKTNNDIHKHKQSTDINGHNTNTLSFQLWKVVLFDNMNNIDIDNDELNTNTTSTLTQCCTNALRNFCRTKNWNQWCVTLCSGGRFAIGIFQEDKCILHRTCQRYTIRRKQGGNQITKDNRGNAPQSLGASKRRSEWTHLKQTVLLTLKEWHYDLLSCSRIYVYAPGINREVIFQEGRGNNDINETLFSKSDPRIRNIPFTVRRPTFEEMKRIHHLLSHVLIIDKPSISEKEKLISEKEKLKSHLNNIVSKIKHNVELNTNQNHNKIKKPKEQQRKKKEKEQKKYNQTNTDVTHSNIMNTVTLDHSSIDTYTSNNLNIESNLANLSLLLDQEIDSIKQVESEKIIKNIISTAISKRTEIVEKMSKRELCSDAAYRRLSIKTHTNPCTKCSKHIIIYPLVYQENEFCSIDCLREYCQLNN